jgi:hypothetical protein
MSSSSGLYAAAKSSLPAICLRRVYGKFNKINKIAASAYFRDSLFPLVDCHHKAIPISETFEIVARDELLRITEDKVYRLEVVDELGDGRRLRAIESVCISETLLLQTLLHFPRGEKREDAWMTTISIPNIEALTLREKMCVVP